MRLPSCAEGAATVMTELLKNRGVPHDAWFLPEAPFETTSSVREGEFGCFDDMACGARPANGWAARTRFSRFA
jgi:hypothetical protein